VKEHGTKGLLFYQNIVSAILDVAKKLS